MSTVHTVRRWQYSPSALNFIFVFYIQYFPLLESWQQIFKLVVMSLYLSVKIKIIVLEDICEKQHVHLKLGQNIGKWTAEKVTCLEK